MTALLLSLLLAAPVFAQAEAPETPAPTMSAEARATALAAIGTALAAGDHDKVFEILEDPAQAGVHGAGWAMLAQAYEDAGLEVAAVHCWARAFEADGAAQASNVDRAIALAEKVGYDRELAAALGSNLGIPVEGATRNALARVAGRYHLREGNLGPALGALMLGDQGAPGFEDVALLRGVVMAQQSRFADAVDILEQARGLGRAAQRGDKWDSIATINVARSYYGSDEWGPAILWYSRVPRSSPVWLDAQFERAWSHFRSEDMNGTLGLLMNHGSPWFEDHYQPEVDLLRSYALFLLCKFPDASREMDAFVEKYEPMKKELDSLGEMSDKRLFEDVMNLRDGNAITMPYYVLRPFETEDRFGEAIRFVSVVEAERSTAEGMGNTMGNKAITWYQAALDDTYSTEAGRVRARIAAARQELDGMLTGIEITRLDLLNLEAQMYERAAATGVLDYGDKIGRLRSLKKERRGFDVWPWQGEYWADELGWYVVDTRPDCPASMNRDDGTNP